MSEKESAVRADAVTEAKTEAKAAPVPKAAAKTAPEEKPLMIVTNSPHIRSSEGTRSIMLDVIIAGTPIVLAATYFYGLRALAITLVCVAASVLFELLYTKLMKKRTTVGDLSAAVTGLILAFNLPPSVPLWMPVVGSFFAIVVAKQLFGGIGKNFMNPALSARVFLFSWPALMTTFVAPSMGLAWVDGVATATPLSTLKQGFLPEESLGDLAMGFKGGSIGEMSVILIVAAFAYLCFRRVITWQTPVAFVGTVALLSFVFSPNPDAVGYMAAQVLSGGLMVGAVFMATDYATTPVTPWGKIIFGVGCGLITVFLRRFGGYNEGVSFAILIMNTLTWFIDRATKPRVFGGRVRRGS